MDTDNDSGAYTRLLLDGALPEAGLTLSIAACADGALNAFRRITSDDLLTGIDGSQLLTERATLLGLANPGRISANGTCRLIPTRSCWIALNLAREEDWTLIPAWLSGDVSHDGNHDWQQIESTLLSRCGIELAKRARLMGLPVAVFNSYHGAETDPARYLAFPSRKRTKKSQLSPLVVDLSSLWAGPLCSHLLQLAGATVIKVESQTRPDSTRISSPAFHELLNAGKYSVCLDLTAKHDIVQLDRLLRRADIVIESSRPRALQQLGIDADGFIRHRPGLIWLSITGYGRSEPWANWVAFGDDAAVAAGAALVDENGMRFIGDALSDPLTGIHGAIIAMLRWQTGSGGLVDISLAGITAYMMRHLGAVSCIDVRSDKSIRSAAAPVHALGSDNDQILN